MAQLFEQDLKDFDVRLSDFEAETDPLQKGQKLNGLHHQISLLKSFVKLESSIVGKRKIQALLVSRENTFNSLEQKFLIEVEINFCESLIANFIKFCQPYYESNAEEVEMKECRHRYDSFVKSYEKLQAQKPKNPELRQKQQQVLGLFSREIAKFQKTFQQRLQLSPQNGCDNSQMINKVPTFQISNQQDTDKQIQQAYDPSQMQSQQIYKKENIISQQLVHEEDTQRELQHEINQIAKDIHVINQNMSDMSTLINYQGEQINAIESLTEFTLQNVQNTEQDLKQANNEQSEYWKKSLALKGAVIGGGVGIIFGPLGIAAGTFVGASVGKAISSISSSHQQQ